MIKKTYYTKESLEKAKKNLKEKLKEKKQLADQFAIARDLGDASESGERDATIQKNALLSEEIQALESQIASATIIDASKVNISTASILNKVKVKDQQTQQIITYKLVPLAEADAEKGFISVTSLVAKGLLGKKVGDIAKIEVPAGKLTYEILEISI